MAGANSILVGLFWSAVGFACGALPFSVWIGAAWLGKDIRTVGDANPGATNVWRAGGRMAAALALILDMLKGSLSVVIAYHILGVRDAWLVPIALAPIAGHAYSPLLRGRGGKAVAVTGGVWAALTAWEGPTIGGLGLLAATLVFGANGWAVMIALIAIAFYMAWAPPAWNGLFTRPEPAILLWIILGNIVIVASRHVADLSNPPRRQRRRQL